MRYVLGVLLIATAPAAAPAQPTTTRPAPPVLRGPVRVRLATAGADIVTDMTMKMLSEVPRAVADSVRSGNYQLSYQFSVTRPGQPADATPAPPVPSQPVPVQPAPSPQPRRLFFRR